MTGNCRKVVTGARSKNLEMGSSQKHPFRSQRGKLGEMAVTLERAPSQLRSEASALRKQSAFTAKSSVSHNSIPGNRYFLSVCLMRSPVLVPMGEREGEKEGAVLCPHLQIS